MTKRMSGFTLVELMVAIAVVGIISVVIYSIFNTTSQNFYEVNQLADLNDRVRFAVETVRNDLQAAGNQGTPDSNGDDWVFPKPGGGLRIAGLVPYAGWQDDATQLPADIEAVNKNVSFDGIVVVGAIDFPLSFEFAGLENVPRVGRIYANNRGLAKLVAQDLFSNNVTPTAPPPDLNNTIGANFSTRLLRLRDRQGNMQFVQPLTLTYAAPDEWAEVAVPADGAPLSPKFKGTGVNDTGQSGLDALSEGDTGYDAGLLDAYWIHVVPSTADDRVMTLVRDRLCAADVVTNGFAAGFNPVNHLASTCVGGTDERVVLASYVADFQVWFDCADTTDGALRDAAWSTGWDPTDNTGDCMDPAAPAPGEARAAHIRLAMHTKTERTDQRHIQFEDAAGAVCNPDDNSCATGRIPAATLRTFDFFPDTEGAARVVVMQSDFELVNFVNANVH